MMNTLVRVVCLTVLMAVGASARAADLSGTWQGDLNAGGTILPLVVHLKEKDGQQIGSLDSPSQGAYDLPLTRVQFDEDSILIEISSMGIHYEASYQPESGALVGTFIQGQPMPLTLVRPEATAIEGTDSSDPADIVGTWQGVIAIPNTPLTFVIHIHHQDGQYQASGDSPDQGATDLPISSVTFESGQLNFTSEKLGVEYQGTMHQDLSAIEGTFKQGGGAFKLTLTRDAVETTQAPRPQTPEGPFPYQVETVTVANTAADLTLAGTLTRPENAAPLAVAVMITGSGPQDRDETLFRHKPFAIIADYLTREGYAVLRLDDRGVGESTGDFSAATSEDFVTDISAAVDYLLARDDLKSADGQHHVGLIGHSEGGMVGPMLAAERDDLAFVIMMAGPGAPITELLAEQIYLARKVGGGDEAVLAAQRTRNQAIFEAIASLPAEAPLSDEVQALMREDLAATGITDAEQQQTQIEQLLETYDTPWFRFFMRYDPADYIGRVTAPVLAFNGSVDLQVAADSNLGGLRTLFAQSKHEDVTITELEGLNHLFQASETGSVNEYARLTESFSPRALELMHDWLDQRFGAG